MSNGRYLYLAPQFDHCATIERSELSSLTERHSLALGVASLEPCAPPAIEPQAGLNGVVIEVLNGWPWPAQMKLARRWLRAGKRAFFYWPAEEAIELADEERLRSYRNLCGAVWAGTHALNLLRRFRGIGLAQSLLAGASARSEAVADGTGDAAASEPALTGLEEIAKFGEPVSLVPRLANKGGGWRVDGLGIYLRTDYWAPIKSGGSYGHTCHVANELARASRGFVCLMANRFDLLDEMGLNQVVVPIPIKESHEVALLRANTEFYVRLRAAVAALAPAYIYERAVLGNYVGARLSKELQIPYLLEYNGSEISMSKSFGGGGYQREADFLMAESAAFKQATVISVISEHVRSDVLSRGVDSAKVLVNPNGVDLEHYRERTPEERSSVRESLGFTADDRVIGFIGTFGGWHGIDTLAAALPLVCERSPTARFLLIGDGNKKCLVDEVIQQHRLWGRVTCTGQVPQQEGARLLGACDVFVSPHNAHMVDSRFFGSPTKIFEYMAMSTGIVASDLEQIGEVLSPGLRADALAEVKEIGAERAVLCRPGQLEEFVDAVVFLCERPEVARALGRNARKAAEDVYAWPHHVQRLLEFAATGHSANWEEAHGGSDAGSATVPKSEAGPDESAAPNAEAGTGSDEAGRARLDTGDRYKDEVQNQWDNDPCGSHYVKNIQPHTLNWFLEVERYRYGEYAPWMPELMEFSQHAGKKLLEIGAGMGTDHAQFAKRGALVTDIDLSSGHLELARENFALRGLQGNFIHHDAETLPFEDGTFDVVYSCGVIHHTPNTQKVIDEIHRVLKPGGRVIIMVYAENSLHYWRNLVASLGVAQGRIYNQSIGQIMSDSVELSDNDAKPLVKVYTARRLRQMFARFDGIEIHKCQLTPAEMPKLMRWMPVNAAGRLMGWNLVLKACKSR